MRKFILLVAVLIAACDSAQAADLSLNYTQSTDSTKITINWTIPNDGHGPVDSVKVAIAGGFSLDTTVVASGNLVITTPNVVDNRTISVGIWSIRSGKISTIAKKVEDFVIPGVIPPPPAPDSIHIQLDSAQTAFLFVEPDSLSPHFSFISRTYTDFCYCWDGAAGKAAKIYGAKLYDLVMSGDGNSWKLLNPRMTWLRYNLVISTLDEANNDPNSITGKWQDDMRVWYANNGYSDSSYEAAFLHTKGTARDSANRLNPFIWSTRRFFGNPRDSIFTKYTRSRLLRGLNGDGYFLDEMDHNNLKWIAQSQEFADLDTTQAHQVFVDWIHNLGQYLDSATGRPIMLQTNAAGYSSGQFDKAVGIAAGSMHLELMNLATQAQPSVWNLIDELLAKGVYIDFVGAETWQDMLNPKWATKFPGGNYLLPVYRTKVSQLASYYMVVGTDPQKIGLQAENNRNTVRPDSTDLKIYHLNVGHPIESRKVAYQTTDPIGQTAKVWKRDFTNARILYRAINSYKDSVFTDTTKVSIPDSLFSGYTFVNARGILVPLNNGLELRNGEAAILIPTDRIQ